MKKIITLSLLTIISIVANGQVLEKNYYESAKRYFHNREYAKAMAFFDYIEREPDLKKKWMAYDANEWRALCLDSLFNNYNKAKEQLNREQYEKALVYFEGFCKIANFFSSKDEIDILSNDVIIVDSGDSSNVLAFYLSRAYNYKGVCLSYIPKSKDEEQKECYVKAIYYDEDNPYPYSNIARGIRQGLFKNTTKYSEVWLYEKAFNLGHNDTWVADSITVEYERLKFYGEASKWAKKGAEMGSNYSKVRLANYFMFHSTSCRGLSLTASKIMSYLNEAAKDETEKIAAEAKLYLGVIYTNGKCGNESIAKNEYLAKKLINESAALGNKQAKELQNAINGY